MFTTDPYDPRVDNGLNTHCYYHYYVERYSITQMLPPIIWFLLMSTVTTIIFNNCVVRTSDAQLSNSSLIGRQNQFSMITI